MSEPLQFMMGKYAAEVPADLYYSRNHFWCRVVAGKNRFGFSSYAIKLMQDVYFLDWQVNAGDKVALLEQIGHIETSKAVSDLLRPLRAHCFVLIPMFWQTPLLLMWMVMIKAGCLKWMAVSIA